MKIKIEERASPLILTFENDREMGAIRFAIETRYKEFPNSVYAEQLKTFHNEVDSFYRKRVADMGFAQ